MERKIGSVQKKGRQTKKFWGMRQKSRGTANLRSAPGGRHPSYTTASEPRSKHYWKLMANDNKKIAYEYQVYQK